MNNDEKFQQRWEFRRRGDDGDSSSDDSKMSSRCEAVDKKHKLVCNLGLPENDEVNDVPRCHQHNRSDTNNVVHFHSVEDAKEKVKSSKKKNVVPNKSKRFLVVKENRKRNRSLSTKEMVMLEDLKTYADSLIHELKVAREDMSAQMREEMRKLVPSRPILVQTKKKARCSQKSKVHHQSRIELDVKTQTWSREPVQRSMKSNVTSDATNFSEDVEATIKHDQVLELTTTNELRSLKSNVASDASNFSKAAEAALTYDRVFGLTTTKEPHKGENLRPSMKTHMILSSDSDRIVSSPFLTIPTIIPVPQIQNDRNGIPLYDHIPAGVPRNNSGSEVEIGKLMDAKNYYHGFPAFLPEEQLGSFPRINRNAVSFLGQNCSQTASVSVGFPVPLHQGLGNNSSMSNPTYPENSFRDKSEVGPRKNSGTLRYPGGNPALSEYVLANKQ